MKSGVLTLVRRKKSYWTIKGVYWAAEIDRGAKGRDGGRWTGAGPIIR